jgi:hypothetical protein
MGLRNFLFGKPVKIENYFFGQMRFIGNKKDSSKSYFECKRFFKPGNETIAIGISGEITGPTRQQINFFESVEYNYDEISNSIIPVIEDEFRNWKEDFKIIDFKKEFIPVYLTIPRCETKPVAWEIAFESEQDRNHTFTLTMENFTAISILIDG